MEVEVGDCWDGGGAVLFNKKGEWSMRIDASVLISTCKCQEDADNLICCHQSHENGPGDDDGSVCPLLMCLCGSSYFLCTSYLFCQNGAVCTHSAWHMLHVCMCVHAPSTLSAHLSV